MQVHSGHNFNWEYANLSIPLNIPYALLTVYMPISNQWFDKIFYRMRAKTGAKLISAINIRNELLPHRNEKYALALVADQNPGDARNAFWVNFFNRPTPFVRAPEMVQEEEIYLSYFPISKKSEEVIIKYTFTWQKNRLPPLT